MIPTAIPAMRAACSWNILTVLPGPEGIEAGDDGKGDIDGCAFKGGDVAFLDDEDKPPWLMREVAVVIVEGVVKVTLIIIGSRVER